MLSTRFLWPKAGQEVEATDWDLQPSFPPQGEPLLKGIERPGAFNLVRPVTSCKLT